MLEYHQLLALTAAKYNLRTSSFNKIKSKIGKVSDKELVAYWRKFDKYKDPKTGKYRSNKGLTSRRVFETELYLGRHIPSYQDMVLNKVKKQMKKT
jgi:hypothetical protein